MGAMWPLECAGRLTGASAGALPPAGSATWRGWRHGSGTSRRTAKVLCTAQKDPYRLLQVERSSSRAEVRSAYITQIKLLHPDVNQGADTTAQAAALNAAYESILAALERGEGPGGSLMENDRLDVFDRPEAAPSEIFVNPFACFNVSPLAWEQLQQVVVGAADPEEALSRAGVAFDYGTCVVYLSPQQLQLVLEELERMSAAMDTISIEVTSFFLRDCLLRARIANNRWAATAAAAAG